ncbi:hypothetical protein ABPG77_005445 [Micractinium sp. CCAP 211/92]
MWPLPQPRRRPRRPLVVASMLLITMVALSMGRAVAPGQHTDVHPDLLALHNSRPAGGAASRQSTSPGADTHAAGNESESANDVAGGGVLRATSRWLLLGAAARSRRLAAQSLQDRLEAAAEAAAVAAAVEAAQRSRPPPLVAASLPSPPPLPPPAGPGSTAMPPLPASAPPPMQPPLPTPAQASLAQPPLTPPSPPSPLQQPPPSPPQVQPPLPPPLPPWPPAAPYQWVPLDTTQRRRADDFIIIFENSSLEPQYGYAANLNDGRGITFGRAGFTTGTGDGLLVVERYVEDRPQDNPLARYLPLLRRSMAARTQLESGGAPAASAPAVSPPGPAGRTEQGTSAGALAPAPQLTAEAPAGAPALDLNGFAETVHSLANDPAFRKAQDDVLNEEYYQGSQQAAAKYGLRSALAKAQLYDAWVQHGQADPGSRVYPVSANGIADWTCSHVGGAPLAGINETMWLEAFLRRRRWVLQSDSSWASSVARVDVFKWLLQLRAFRLDRPIRLLWDRCTAATPEGHPRGPCANQTATAYAIGGVDYGTFLIP